MRLYLRVQRMMYTENDMIDIGMGGRVSKGVGGGRIIVYIIMIVAL